MDPYISVLFLRSPPGRRQEAIEQFKDHRILKICQDSVPGFISGKLLSSHDDPELACVIGEWTTREAFEQWMASPLRSPSLPDRIFEATDRSSLFEVVEALERSAAAQ